MPRPTVRRHPSTKMKAAPAVEAVPTAAEPETKKAPRRKKKDS